MLTNLGISDQRPATVTREQADMFVRNLRLSLPINCFLACSAAAMMLSYQPTFEIMAWLVTCLSLNLVRFLPASTHRSLGIRQEPSKLLRTCFLGSLASGLLWSIIPICFVEYAGNQAAFISIILCGLTAGAAIQGNGFAAPVIAMVVPILGAMTVKVFFLGTQSGYILSLDLLIYLTVIVRSSIIGERTLVNSVLVKTEARDLAERYRMLVENASDMIFRLDRDLVRTYVSPASTEILGYAPEELVGRKASMMAHAGEAETVAQTYTDVLNGLERTDVTSRIRHKDGRWLWIEVNLRALRDPGTNEVTGILGALRDVSQRKHAEELVAESEARFRMLAENTADLVTHVDATGKRIFASPAARDLLGYAPEELIGGQPLDLAYPDDRPLLDAMLEKLAEGRPAESVQYRARRKDGVYRWIEATGRPLGPERGYILALRDIDRRKQAEDELEAAVLRLNALANSDGLTGLANRRRFDETLAREVSRAARTGASISLLLADVDHFKTYNDTYGHPAGDVCLRTVAEVLAATIRRPGDVAARYGGEEFAAILPETDEAGALALAEVFRKKVAESAKEHARSAFGVVTISVGVVTVTPRLDATKPSDLVEAADSALYAAKGGGRNCVRQFNFNVATLSEAS